MPTMRRTRRGKAITMRKSVIERSVVVPRERKESSVAKNKNIIVL